MTARVAGWEDVGLGGVTTVEYRRGLMEAVWATLGGQTLRSAGIGCQTRREQETSTLRACSAVNALVEQ